MEPHNPVTRKLSEHERTIHIQRRLGANMFDTLLPITSEKIETQTINLFVNEIDQFLAKARPLVRFNFYLEHGKLYALPKITAGFCYSS